MKCPLKVWIARSAKFHRCVSGGASCIVHRCLITFLRMVGASLSRMCSFGVTVLVLVSRS